MARVGGRAGWQWLGLAGSWLARRTRGATTTLAAPARPAAGQLSGLPGIGSLELVASASGAGLYCWDRRERTLTAAVAVSGPGLLLVDPATRDARVGDWGRLLGGLCRLPGIVRVQVLVRTGPAPSAAIRGWWAEMLTTPDTGTERASVSGTPGWAGRVLRELLADTGGVSSTQCLLALAVRVPGRTPTAAVQVLDRQVAALGQALAAAQLSAGPALDRSGWQAAVRAAYDPYTAAHQALNAHPVAEPATEGDDLDADSPVMPDAPTTAVAGVGGPMGVREGWDHVIADTAHHGVYWISDWPRVGAGPDFLHPLLCAPGASRTLSLTATPVPARRALREIRRAQVDAAADAASRARIGQLEDEAGRAQARDLARREADLVAGHSELAFTGLLTVTAPNPDALAAARLAAETDAAQAMCELRLLVGQQAAALSVAGLPLARGLS